MTEPGKLSGLQTQRWYSIQLTNDALAQERSQELHSDPGALAPGHLKLSTSVAPRSSGPGRDLTC